MWNFEALSGISNILLRLAIVVKDNSSHFSVYFVEWLYMGISMCLSVSCVFLCFICASNLITCQNIIDELLVVCREHENIRKKISLLNISSFRAKHQDNVFDLLRIGSWSILWDVTKWCIRAVSENKLCLVGSQHAIVPEDFFDLLLLLEIW